MMEPHMIENYIQFVLVISFNHVGFIILLLLNLIYFMREGKSPNAQ